MKLTEQILTQIPGDPWQGLQQADKLWRAYRDQTLPSSVVVQSGTGDLAAVDWDVVICGGTLGIMLGAALACRGWRVALLERGRLRGRDQEWNISRQELMNLVQVGVLEAAELPDIIATTYNPARIQFGDGPPVWVKDVLNIGVDPVALLERLKQTFLEAGGHLYEYTAFQGAVVYDNGVEVLTGQDDQRFTTRLLIDVMGHFSPIARQARQGQNPDAVCLVVGSCAQGFPPNDSGDLIVSFTPLIHQCQYFWEAFPARDGRTTYLFTYVDPHPDRPDLTWLFEEYLRLLPEYQGLTLDRLQFQRALFGFFPSYRRSPLHYPWGRLLAAGDSSGLQSPLSFGGFGAMIRHLPRLVVGVHEALQLDLLDAPALHQLQPYQPNLSVTWLFQKAMSVGIDQFVPPDQINRLLSAVFQDMASLGEVTLKPFLQDVVQFSGLTRTLLKSSVMHPGIIPQVLPQVGLGTLLDWLRHYGVLASYSALHPLAEAGAPLTGWLSPTQAYYYHRWQDALRYGAGQDYHI